MRFQRHKTDRFIEDHGANAVICGDSDPYLNYDLVGTVKESLPKGSELVMIKGGSHVVYIEKPYYKAFRDGIKGFLLQP